MIFFIGGIDVFPLYPKVVFMNRWRIYAYYISIYLRWYYGWFWGFKPAQQYQHHHINLGSNISPQNLFRRLSERNYNKCMRSGNPQKSTSRASHRGSWGSVWLGGGPTQAPYLLKHQPFHHQKGGRFQYRDSWMSDPRNIRGPPCLYTRMLKEVGNYS